MKKKISICLLVALAVFTFMIPVGATGDRTDVTAEASVSLVENEVVVKQFSDGSKLTRSFTVDSPLTRLNGTYSGHSDLTFSDSHGEKQWVFTVYGTFEINGSYVNCISASCNYTIYQSGWKHVSSSAYPNGNQAVGNIVIKRTMLGVTVRTYDENNILYCDANANFS